MSLRPINKVHVQMVRCFPFQSFEIVELRVLVLIHLTQYFEMCEGTYY